MSFSGVSSEPTSGSSCSSTEDPEPLPPFDGEAPPFFDPLPPLDDSVAFNIRLMVSRARSIPDLTVSAILPVSLVVAGFGGEEPDACAAALAHRWQYVNHPHNWQKNRHPKWRIVGFLLDAETERYLLKIARRRIDRMKKTTQGLMEEVA